MPRADLDHLFTWEVNLPDAAIQRSIASRLKEQMAAVGNHAEASKSCGKDSMI